jgi:hypothetical protein
MRGVSARAATSSRRPAHLVRRWVSIPPFLLVDVIEHLEQFTGPAGDAPVFTGPKGAQLHRSNFTRSGARHWKRPG